MTTPDAPPVASGSQVHPTPEWARPSKSLLLPAFWVVLILTTIGAILLVVGLILNLVPINGNRRLYY